MVRGGNALLLATTYDGNAGPADSVAKVDAADAAPVVKAMRLFGEHR